MTEPREQQEPSMEEILSSIRRIIADEEAEEGGPEDEAAAAASDRDAADLAEGGDEDEDVLELTRMVRDSGEVVDLRSEQTATDASGGRPGEAEAVDAVDGDDPDEVEFASIRDKRPEPAAYETPEEEQPAVSTHQAAAESLISATAATAASGSFAKLSQAFQRTSPEDSAADDSGRTVEQFVEDMIRPMLKAWMDENLPPIIERLVEKEIQKMARRAELI